MSCHHSTTCISLWNQTARKSIERSTAHQIKPAGRPPHSRVSLWFRETGTNFGSFATPAPRSRVPEAIPSRMRTTNASNADCCSTPRKRPKNHQLHRQPRHSTPREYVQAVCEFESKSKDKSRRKSHGILRRDFELGTRRRSEQ